MNDSADSSLPLIAVTLGDPCGVGPEIVARALTGDGAPRDARCFIVGAESALRQGLEVIGREDVPVQRFDSIEEIVLRDSALALLEPIGLRDAGACPLGKVCAEGGEAAFLAVETAARLAVEGRVDAICTAPLHKKALQLAGRRFPGHTEILSEIAGDTPVVMLLEGGGLRVALATIHISLREVPARLTKERVMDVTRIVHDALIRDFAVAAPRVAVTGLNPHAGDDGVLGDEEKTMIAPAIEAMRSEGIDASGPWPADVVFHQMLGGRFDAVVAMYHDQGLAALKTLAFDEGVNITLGLPFVRTSPDHGTAMDIAGQGKADARSMIAALASAAAMVRQRRAFDSAHRS